MTLTNRLSMFFLGALAVVLVGFATALYLLARTYLYRQADERLEAALNTLTAAVEIGPDAVEWEPNAHRLPGGMENGPDRIGWQVRMAGESWFRRGKTKPTISFAEKAGRGS